MTLALVTAVACVVVTVGNCRIVDGNIDTATKYLTRYGYLNENAQPISAKEARQALHNAVALFQEYYRIPGRGDLNNITLEYMRKPRCGLQDLSYHASMKPLEGVWPKRHLTWNFHLANENILRVTRAAFALWATNSSLTFERDTQHPDILISFREGLHVMRSGQMCPETLDGPGGVLAHAWFPNGERDHVGEVHIDKAEPWHILLDRTPPQTFNLLHTLTHEIGHSLGLHHSELRESIMYALAPEDPPVPIKLSLEDILKIRQLYGTGNGGGGGDDDGDAAETVAPPPPPTTAAATTTTTTTTAVAPRNDDDDAPPTDPCALQNVDSVLIMDKRMYIAHERYVWSIDVNGRSYDRPLLLTHFMRFLPKNFTRLSAAYRKPSGELVLFANNLIYMVTYPDYKLARDWPKTFSEFGIAPDARINAALNTNKGQSFVIYNGHVVGEIDDCTMRVMRHHNIQDIFPGIPYGVSSAFRYIDGNLYFIHERQFYAFNEFARTVTTAGKFDLKIVGVTCPRNELLQELRDLLDRVARISDTRRDLL